jgi:hypothetical protein
MGSANSRVRAPAFHPLNYGQNTPAELRNSASVALKVLGLLLTSASVERAFSVARSVTTDYQMAMTQETISERMMIQVNCCIARRYWLTCLRWDGQGGNSKTKMDIRKRTRTKAPDYTVQNKDP